MKDVASWITPTLTMLTTCGSWNYSSKRVHVIIQKEVQRIVLRMQQQQHQPLGESFSDHRTICLGVVTKLVGGSNRHGIGCLLYTKLVQTYSSVAQRVSLTLCLRADFMMPKSLQV